MDAFDLTAAINGDPDFNVATLDLTEKILNDEGLDWDADDVFDRAPNHAQYIGDVIYEQLICESIDGRFGDVLLEAIYDCVDWYDVGLFFFNGAVNRKRKAVA